MSNKASIAPILPRFSAFVTDMFLIAMPLLYIVTYAILGSKESFQGNQLAISITWTIFGVIQALFFSISSQTPGYKAHNFSLLTIKGQKPSFIICIIRYLIFVVGFIFGGSLFCFFRKDKRNLHDLIAGTIVVIKKEEDKKQKTKKIFR